MSATLRLMGSLRLLVDKILGRETVLDFDVLGTPMRLAVVSRREIRRAHATGKEVEFVGRMVEALREGDTIWDVGANIGVISLLLIGRTEGEASRVHAFEPEPQNFRQLLRNIAENGREDRITAHRLALGDRIGEIELFVRGGPGEGRHSTVAAAGSTGTIEVGVQTADAFAASDGAPPDLVKIDVEGAEGRVLAGMESLLAGGRPRELFMELHPKGEADRMPDGSAIHDWLAERGYERIWQSGHGSRAHCHYRPR